MFVQLLVGDSGWLLGLALTNEMTFYGRTEVIVPGCENLKISVYFINFFYSSPHLNSPRTFKSKHFLKADPGSCLFHLIS